LLIPFYHMIAGNSWAHQATTRMIMYWEGDQRRAHLYKSPSLPATSVDFFVTEAGIRGRKTQKRTRE
jgi:RAD51-like protein 2